MTALADDGTWKHCNLCKAPIAFQAEYFVCSVSTCNRKRTGLFFCSLACFEAHLPTARHRDAWAERERAPTQAQWQAALAADDSRAGGSGTAGAQPVAAASPRPGPAPRAPVAPGSAPGNPAPGNPAPGNPAPGGPGRRIVEAPGAATASSGDGEAPEVLIVVSKLKKYVRDWSGMNTSDAAMSVLSEHVRELCREATRQAGLDGRRTVLDRDFEKVLAERREAMRKGDFDSRR